MPFDPPNGFSFFRRGHGVRSVGSPDQEVTFDGLGGDHVQCSHELAGIHNELYQGALCQVFGKGRASQYETF